MDILYVLRPTMTFGKIFGISWLVTSPDSGRASKLWRIYCCFVSCANISLQLTGFVYHAVLRYGWKQFFKAQDIILLLCIFSNSLVSFLPLRNVMSNKDHIRDIIMTIDRYEKEMFRISQRTLRLLHTLSLAIIASGLGISVVFTNLEAFRVWRSSEIGKYGLFVDAITLAGSSIRICMNFVYLNSYITFTVVHGACYSEINGSIKRYARRSAAAKGTLEYLKHLERFDNALKDLHAEVTLQHACYSVITVFLAFTNWFYVIGYIFLDLSPKYKTFITWGVYFSMILVSLIAGSVYARNEAERTASLVHELCLENDSDARVQEELEILSLQLLHRKVEFDACGFFKLDFSLLLSMFRTVATYVLILLQFEDNYVGNETEKCRPCLNDRVPLTNDSHLLV